MFWCDKFKGSFILFFGLIYNWNFLEVCKFVEVLVVFYISELIYDFFL